MQGCVPLPADLSWQRSQGQSIILGFLASVERYPNHVAIQTRSESITYAGLGDLAGRIARLLVDAPRPAPVLGAILGERCVATYAGLLGTLLSGAGCVPLNPKFPPSRNLQMLELCKPSTLVVDEACLPLADSLLGQVSHPMVVVRSSRQEIGELQARHPRHRFFGTAELAAQSPLTEAPCTHEDAIAYVLFTSGSTGVPKGVMLSHKNILHYLQVMGTRYQYTPDDRCSQTTELTFDVSMHDIFMCWGAGARLYPATPGDLLSPLKYIRDNELTVWFCVPSAAILMKQFGTLKPGVFPSLRISLFAGEPMPASVAEAWQQAAPKSVVENGYGPTEATILCTIDRWRSDDADSIAEGFMSTGRPLSGLSTAIVDERRQLVPRGVMGELCVAGPQVTWGYWGDEQMTSEKFVAMPWYSGPDNRWYRTGDLAIQNEDGRLSFKGRIDDQVKIRGFRVELLEIEHVLKQVAATEFAAVLAYPLDTFSPTGTRAFVCGSQVEMPQLLKQMRERLPDYMVPQEVYYLTEMPLNDNGKIDKKALKQRLAESTHANGG
jgi:amino acid adenylation domain-containing protein